MAQGRNNVKPGPQKRRRRTKQTQPARIARPSKQLRQQIRLEAKKLGLSTEEYLRLVVSVSSSLRKGIADDASIDGAKLVEWVDNPMFQAMIQWLSKSVVSTMQSDSSADDNQTPESQNPASPQGQQPNQGYQQGHGQQFQQQPQPEQRPNGPQGIQQRPMHPNYYGQPMQPGYPQPPRPQQPQQPGYWYY